MGEVKLRDLHVGPHGRNEDQRQGDGEEDHLRGVGEDVDIEVVLQPGGLLPYAVAVEDQYQAGEEDAQAARHVDQDVRVTVPDVKKQIGHHEEERENQDKEAQRGDEPLPLLRVREHPVDDVEGPFYSRDLLHVDLHHGIDGGARRYDGIHELVLRAVPHQDYAFGLHLVQHGLELFHQLQVGLVPDGLVPAYEGDLGVPAVGPDVETGLYGGIEGVRVGVLGVGQSKGGGGFLAGLHPYGRGRDLAHDAEIVIPVDGQNESPPHALTYHASAYYH